MSLPFCCCQQFGCDILEFLICSLKGEGREKDTKKGMQEGQQGQEVEKKKEKNEKEN